MTTWFTDLEISKKLIISIMIASSILTLMITMVQLYIDFSKDIRSIESRFTIIRENYLPILKQSLWTVDENQLIVQAQSILKFPDIQFVKIVTDSNKTFAFGRKQPSRIISQSFEIVSTQVVLKKPLGTVYIEASLTSAYDRLLSRVTIIFFSQILKTFIISLFIYFLVYQFIIRHLTQISTYFRRLRLDNLSQELVLQRPLMQNPRDEIDILTLGINKMRLNLRDEVIAKEDVEQDLRLLNVELENKVKARTQELQNSLNELQNFYNFVSHEMRTPIAAIQPYIRGLQKGMRCSPLDDQQLVHLNVIERNVERLLSLVNQVLDLARAETRLDTEHHHVIDLHTLILLITEQFKGLFTDDVVLQLEFAPQDFSIKASQDHVESILANLISNAGKYTQAGMIKIRTIPWEGGVQIFVSDTGAGIDAEHLSTIFDRFTRVNDNHQIKGTGLGLYLVKRFVDQLGGTIECSSVKGEGSTFCVWLPCQ